LKEVISPFLDFGKCITNGFDVSSDKKEDFIESIIIKIDEELSFDNFPEIVTNVFFEIDSEITVSVVYLDINRFGEDNGGYVFLTPRTVNPLVIGKK